MYYIYYCTVARYNRGRSVGDDADVNRFVRENDCNRRRRRRRTQAATDRPTDCIRTKTRRTCCITITPREWRKMSKALIYYIYARYTTMKWVLTDDEIDGTRPEFRFCAISRTTVPRGKRPMLCPCYCYTNIHGLMICVSLGVCADKITIVNVCTYIYTITLQFCAIEQRFIFAYI